MPVRIKIARTTADLDAVFRLRHQVYVEEEGYMTPHADLRIADRFDAFPTTVNIAALVDGRVVGSIRYVEPSVAGTPADEFFDFTPYLPPEGARVGSASMLCVARDYRHVPRLKMAMIGMAHYWAISKGITHLLGPGNPEAESFLRRVMGYRPVAPRFYHEGKQLHTLPMIVCLDDLDDAFLTFLHRQNIEHFLHSFEREFYTAGESIIRYGDQGDTAYVIVDGRVAVTLRNASDADLEDTAEAVLRPGELFGETALLTAHPRTANVVALSDVDLMALDRDQFRAQIRENPRAAQQMIDLLAGRVVEMAERRAAAHGR